MIVPRRLWILVLAIAVARIAWAQADVPLSTVAERSDFKATSKHEEVTALCQALAEQREAVRLIELGKTSEGRSIPALVVAEPMVASADEAQKSGKLVVLAIGNIHAGEVDGKEALPMLVRELTDQSGHRLLKDVVLIVVPSFNPDGNDKMAKDNRPGQVGPEEGMGRRENGQSLDLNRDFVKLEAPETRALVRLINEWNPHIFIDTHTTNGSRHRFLITHAGPKSPAGSRRVNDYVHGTMLPRIDAAMDKDHGWKTFAYGNFDRDQTRWVTYGSEPRYGTTYVGLRNRIAILSEAYAYASFKDRVLATRDFVRSILTFAAENKEEIAALLNEAAAQTSDQVPIRSSLHCRSAPATVLGFVEERKNGRSVATAETKEYTVELWDDFETKESVSRPAAYLVPGRFHGAIETLARHGLNVQVLREDIQLFVDAYKVTRVDRSENAYQGHKLVLDVQVEPRSETRTVPAGTFVVSTAGPLGALAVMLLEPRSEDGLTTWNAFDEDLHAGGDFPVVRLTTAPTVPLLTASVAPPPEAFISAHQRRQVGGGSSPPVRIGSGLRATFVPSAAGFLRWIDNDSFAQLKEGKTFRVRAVTGDAEPLPQAAPEDRSKLVAAFASLPTIEESQARGIAQRATLDAAGKGAFASFESDLYYAVLDGSKALRLTSTPAVEELAEFSPDGKFIAFVRDNDLFVVDVATGTERALTSGGSNRMRNGKADWVYFEEIFDRNWKAYWWSPDSKHIAFLSIDDRAVPMHQVLIDTGGKRVVEETAYPRSGDPNPQVRFGIVAASGGDPRYAELINYSPDSFLISDVGWWPDGSSAYCYAQDRAQTWLDVLKVTPAGGAPTRLFRETTGAWVESLGPIRVLKDGTFLITSERDGWKHLYRYNANGSLKNRVTSGDWEVRGIVRLDEENGWVYVNGTRDNPIGNNVYRAKLDGSALERLSDGPGTHAAVLCPDGSLFVDLFSSREFAPRAALRRADGTLVRTLDSNPEVATPDPNGLKTEIVRITTKDGFVLEGELTLPAGLDDSGKTLYPVWFTTYGGPHFPTMNDTWRGAGPGGGGTAGLVRDGFILFRLDPRSASGKGAKSAWTAYRKLGVQENEDIKEAIAWLKQRPYVDGTRIGMSGHSYGGYLTAFCMTHSDLFAAGIAGAPVTDWRDYDSIYTERYMDTPQNNPDGYDASSVVKAAAKLHGKLLILHGGIDDNVSIRNTMRFIHALQQADKDFELMIYPASRHGIGGTHYQRIQRDFILRTLGGPRPRDGSPTAG